MTDTTTAKPKTKQQIQRAVFRAAQLAAVRAFVAEHRPEPDSTSAEILAAYQVAGGPPIKSRNVMARLLREIGYPLRKERTERIEAQREAVRAFVATHCEPCDHKQGHSAVELLAAYRAAGGSPIKARNVMSWHLRELGYEARVVRVSPSCTRLLAPLRLLVPLERDSAVEIKPTLGHINEKKKRVERIEVQREAVAAFVAAHCEPCDHKQGDSSADLLAAYRATGGPPIKSKQALSLRLRELGHAVRAVRVSPTTTKIRPPLRLKLGSKSLKSVSYLYQRISFLRRAAGLSRVQAAARAGFVPFTEWKRYESANPAMNPDLSTLCRIASALDVPVSVLLEDVAQPANSDHNP